MSFVPSTGNGGLVDLLLTLKQLVDISLSSKIASIKASEYFSGLQALRVSRSTPLFCNNVENANGHWQYYTMHLQR